MPLSPNQMDRLTSGYQAPEVVRAEATKLIAEMRVSMSQILSLSKVLVLSADDKDTLDSVDHLLGLSYSIFK